jgi:hypothetical protein
MIRHISQRQKHNQLRYISELLNEICATTFIKIRDRVLGIYGVQSPVVAVKIPAMFYAVRECQDTEIKIISQTFKTFPFTLDSKYGN